MWLWALTAVAAPYRTGHHHAEYEWYTLRTRWFRIHYPVGTGDHPVDASDTAQRIAAVADPMLLRLGAHTGWVPHGPIHVVVSDEADGMSAYTLPSWGWIVLSADPGVEVGRFRGRRDWVRTAVAHELGHVVAERLASSWATTASYGVETTGSAGIGAVGVGATAIFGPNVPFGWSEGAAESWSAVAGVDAWSSPRSALLRASALHDRLLSWDEWLVSVDKGDVLDPERAYQQGNAFAGWLAAEYGEDVFVRMAEVARQRWHGSWARVLRAVTGEPARVTWGRWRGAVVGGALADAAQLSARGTVEGAPIERTTAPWVPGDLAGRDAWALRGRRDREQDLERTGAFELYPQTSADGRWFAEGKVGWIHLQRGDPAAWPVRDWAAAGAREDRTSATSVHLPAAFGNGYAFVPAEDALIVAAAEDANAPWYAPTPRDAWLQLYRVDLTPDVAAERHRGGTRDGERLRMTPGERRKRMTPIPGTLRARDPAVSPDGTRLAWLAYADGATELRVAGIDGSDPRALPFVRPAMLQHPSWSPDGERIVVSALAADRPDLWVVDVASGAWSALTADPGDEVDPHWSADGVWFASDRDGVFDVFRVDADGQAARMTRTIGGAMTPFVDPAGDLLYSGLTAHGYKAMRVPAADLAYDAVPSFAPSGEPPVVWPATAALDPAPYRWWRSALVPGVSPILRVDAERAGIAPSAGAFVRARDAVERVELTLQGLVGADAYGDAEIVWRGLRPELGAHVTAGLDRRAVPVGTGTAFDVRSWHGYGVDLTARVRDEVAASVSAEEVATYADGSGRIRSLRGTVDLSAGQAPERGDPDRIGADVWLTRALSLDVARGAAGPWTRAEVDLVGGVGLPLTVGPLDEHALRLEGGIAGGITDRDVHPDEQIYAGGDVPAAIRLDAPVGSIPLPGFAAYALGGSTLAAGGADVVVPLAARIRASAGPLYVQGVDAAVGVGAAATPSALGSGDPVALGSASVEVRLSALLYDAPWDSVVRVAWGIGEAPTPPPDGYGVGQSPGPPAGPRLYVGIGTGF
jgi:hypothetical protein